MERLRQALLSDGGAIVAGVLSGTSADGIDVGIARLCAAPSTREIAPPELLAYSTEPFPPDVRARVRAVLDGAPCGLRESALLSRDLGRACGRAARAVATRAQLALDLVGSHGQTVWHHDGREESGAATLQLGDGDFVASETGCIVASDFRQADIAAGGEGAPISALADGAIFARAPRPCAILNLGGISNLTLLGADPRDVVAFDAGPANSLLDGLARALLGTACDVDGASAARGKVDQVLVAELSAHPFFARKPPKSTGRDTFGAAWVGEVIARSRSRGLLERGPDDVLATATAFVAQCVAIALERFVRPAPRSLLVAGGGARNPTLMQALARACAMPVDSSGAAGVDPDAREALVFAVLAARCALEVASTQPSATGAAPGRILGKLSFGGCRPKGPG